MLAEWFCYFELVIMSIWVRFLIYTISNKNFLMFFLSDISLFVFYVTDFTVTDVK